jgi:5'-nucleotidase
MKEEKLILVTNDDGVDAKGIVSLAEAMAHLGKVVVIAPSDPQSGMSQAITVKHPLRAKKVEINGYDRYAVNGTPTDCVKLAFNRLLSRKPDLLVSGINHGSNSSASVLYSGTLGATMEGCINNIPSIGFSLISFDQDADFSAASKYARLIAAKVLENGLPDLTGLNVNIPYVKESEIKGIKICRQAMGLWQEEFEQRTDPSGREYYWLTGKYLNHEPNAEDTDEWALKNNYIAIVPIHVDLTSHRTLEILKKWDIN